MFLLGVSSSPCLFARGLVVWLTAIESSFVFLYSPAHMQLVSNVAVEALVINQPAIAKSFPQWPWKIIDQTCCSGEGWRIKSSHSSRAGVNMLLCKCKYKLSMKLHHLM
jgi:hypothetical protein